LNLAIRAEVVPAEGVGDDDQEIHDGLGRCPMHSGSRLTAHDLGYYTAPLSTDVESRVLPASFGQTRTGCRHARMPR
jgi:hypothetical protein